MEQSDPLAETMRSEGDDPRIGQTIEKRYRIVRRLGEGGMGTVYEGEHLLIKRRVAIKLLNPSIARDPVTAQRFVNEARAATAIGHPNIVEVTDMGQLDDGTAYMVLEYLEGSDLGSLVSSEGPLTVARTVELLTPVCDALRAAHAKGIVHRDLKPQNVFLARREEGPDVIKLLDFGIAKLRGDPANELTRTGQTIGTPYYMSPEQARGDGDIDERTDLYALGVMLYYCLTGSLPFRDESFAMLVVKIIQEPPPPLTRYRTDLPEKLIGIVERLLEKKREDRFPSAAEVKSALSAFAEIRSLPVLKVPEDAPTLDRTGTPRTDPDPVPRAPERANSRAPMFVALGALAVALVAVGILALRPPTATVEPPPTPESPPPQPLPEGIDVPVPEVRQPPITPTAIDAGVPRATKIRHVPTPPVVQTPPPAPEQPPSPPPRPEEPEIFHNPLGP